ncbi:hypothetical protein RRF57_000491 [Xylaria bambusicola]|uniref:Uncharacterized protein n=1 Tax=Xylaria bambusicola TaxID=326684 RepID=A0AAN7U3X4_9PEZI
MLSGLGFLPGALFPRIDASESETVDPALNDGFLCVICDLSTLRNPFVTSLPLLISPNTAPSPESAFDDVSSLICRTGGGPGGGGGGGAPPAAGGAGGAGDAAAPDADIVLAISAADWP